RTRTAAGPARSSACAAGAAPPGRCGSRLRLSCCCSHTSVWFSAGSCPRRRSSPMRWRAGGGRRDWRAAGLAAGRVPMAVIGVGTDLVSMERARKMLAHLGEYPLERLLTEEERKYVMARPDPAPHFAARLAAK